MTNRIYRLVDVWDIGKPVLYKDRGAITVFKDGSSEGYEKGILSHVQDGPRPYCIDRAWYELAVVEVTPADFSKEQLLEGLLKYGTHLMEGFFIRGIDLKDTKIIYIEEQNRRNCWPYKVDSKEKTLADFTVRNMVDEIRVRHPSNYQAVIELTDEELASELIHRKNHLSRHIYNRGYEAGKKDPIMQSNYFERGFTKGCLSSRQAMFDMTKPHVIPQQENVQQKDSCVICKSKIVGSRYASGSDGSIWCSKECWEKSFFQKANGESANYYSPACLYNEKSLPNPEESKSTCEKCGKKLGSLFHLSNNLEHKFCSTVCAREYEWILAELPKDHGKACRVKYKELTEWEYGGVLLGQGSDGKFIVTFLDKDAPYDSFNFCQVRRDSVGETR